MIEPTYLASVAEDVHAVLSQGLLGDGPGGDAAHGFARRQIGPPPRLVAEARD